LLVFKNISWGKKGKKREKKLVSLYMNILDILLLNLKIYICACYFCACSKPAHELPTFIICACYFCACSKPAHELPTFIICACYFCALEQAQK
jgi:hypothetical protein